MQYLVDTNVLLRYITPTDTLSPIIQAAIHKLHSNGDQLYATAQNFVEFWNVATRPVSRNGFGLSTLDAHRRLMLLERIFPLLPDDPTVYLRWRDLVMTFGVVGVQVHDARLVAVMQANGVTHILTFNTADFARYASAGIVAVDPASV